MLFRFNLPAAAGRGLLAALLSAGAAAAQPSPALPPLAPGSRFVHDSLPAYVARGQRLWNIPGVAVVVVKDGQVVVSQGFGTRAAQGQGGPVDGSTLFMLASNSKLFTGTALAQLEQEKKLRLDDPVRQYLPGYRLYDSASSRLVSIRDVLGHKLGLKTFQGDFTFWDSNLSRAEIVARMRLLQPPYPFRQAYGYCNSGFVTAGEIIPAVTDGQRWEDWVQQRLLTPLGMFNTYPLTTGFGQRPNIALPYSTTLGPLTRLPFDELANLGPAAGLVSCADDLAHWLKFQLDSGKYQGRSVLPWATLQRTREANTLLTATKSYFLPSHFVTYGLGVLSADYQGRQVYWHTGGANGYVTNVCFVPEENLGLAVLTNQDNQAFFEALRYQLLDAYLGGPYVDRSRQYWQLLARPRAEATQRRAQLAKRSTQHNKLLRPLSAYAGTYQNPVYGTLTVEPRGRQLLVRFSHHPSLTATLDYLDGDTFRLTYSNPAFGVFAVPFTVENGLVRTLEVRVNEEIETDPYVFSKQ